MDFDDQEEEQEPESLRKKWEAEAFEEEIFEKSFKDCPHCAKKIEAKSFSCLYCGERVFQDSGFLGKWIKYKTHILWLTVFAMMVFSLFVYLVF